MSHRIWFGSAGVMLWLMAVGVKDVLRPWAGRVDSPLGVFLDVGPALFSAAAIPLFFLAVHPAPNGRSVRNAGLWSVLIVTLAEGLERYLPGSIADWKDWLASLAGVALAVAAAWMTLHRRAEAGKVA